MTSPPAKIPGGFGKSYRKELHSEIWLMPPLYHRTWYWLRMNVQYETFLFPTQGKHGIWVLPGQRITSLQQIAEGVKWTEWGREVIPNKKSIKVILEWLQSREMVTVESNAKGTLITVVNWHTYNWVTDEKVTGESNAEETPSGHKEEGIERKEEKRKEAIPFREIFDYLNLKAGRSFKGADPDKRHIRARWMEGHRLEDFKSVIDAKVAEWGPKPEMVAYLRPQTLFGTKFDGYLQAATKSILPASNPRVDPFEPLPPEENDLIRRMLDERGL